MPSESANAEMNALTNMSSDEIFLFVFSPAFEIYDWCRGADNIEEFNEKEIFQVGYKQYKKIAKGEFTKQMDGMLRT